MKHTLSVLVEDESGALSRISGLFARRGFNIESLAVGPTEQDGVSRLTMVVAGDDNALEQMTKQLHKLVNVLQVIDLSGIAAVERELMLVKAKADSSSRGSNLIINNSNDSSNNNNGNTTTTNNNKYNNNNNTTFTRKK